MLYEVITNIAEVLEMTIEEAAEFFAPVPQISRKMETSYNFV